MIWGDRKYLYCYLTASAGSQVVYCGDGYRIVLFQTVQLDEPGERCKPHENSRSPTFTKSVRLYDLVYFGLDWISANS